MKLEDIIPLLSAYLSPEEHKERKIKGGGTWYYLSHQALRNRLNEICPGEWSTEYQLSHMDGTDPIYLCRLTICGVTRTGIGDKTNEPSPYGTTSQRSFRKAFADAAEAFGLGAYLDEQTDDRTKREFVKYMHQCGNGKAAVNYQENQRIERGEPPKKRAIVPDSQPFGQPSMASAQLISQPQRTRLWTIAQNEGGYTKDGFKKLIMTQGFASSKDITKGKYEQLCAIAADKEMAAMYNNQIEAAS